MKQVRAKNDLRAEYFFWKLKVRFTGGCEIITRRIQAETIKVHCSLVCNILGVNLDPTAIRINIKVISPQKEERGVGKMSELKWMSSGV